jgi:hypothetical protein
VLDTSFDVQGSNILFLRGQLYHSSARYVISEEFKISGLSIKLHKLDACHKYWKWLDTEKPFVGKELVTFGNLSFGKLHELRVAAAVRRRNWEPMARYAEAYSALKLMSQSCMCTVADMMNKPY